jgi:hypothetical protein
MRVSLAGLILSFYVAAGLADPPDFYSRVSASHWVVSDLDDMDEAIAYFESQGLACAQSGSWGEEGKPGSGRFASMDTDSLGGIMIELLWDYRE